MERLSPGMAFLFREDWATVGDPRVQRFGANLRRLLLKVKPAFTGIFVQHGIIFDFVQASQASDAHEEMRRRFPAGPYVCIMTQTDHPEMSAEDRLESNVQLTEGCCSSAKKSSTL